MKTGDLVIYKPIVPESGESQIVAILLSAEESSDYSTATILTRSGIRCVWLSWVKVVA